jgi:hypothetical protein
MIEICCREMHLAGGWQLSGIPTQKGNGDISERPALRSGNQA